ncbi:EAL domain-containing protein [Aliagarivorans taiwanensis]|uniref:EAL domain-containing protein n=1 Tax=Aliagarivorans taiwanensis TaxID=561966 RepID=UPI00041AA1F6|nr:EAL domain-containing protein [Aliagarivorans taiwanensis]
MTLYRQLLIVVLVIYGVLLAVVFSQQISAARQVLSEQQQSDINNASTYLGLALQPYLEQQDKVGAESVINAMFDSGYYRQIRLALYQDDSVIDRVNPTQLRDVPAWFTSLELFEQVGSEQVLTSGWLQLGELKVVGHPGYAYLQLWQVLVNLLKLFVVGYLITVLLLIRALQYLLKPLKQIEQRAKEVSKREFGHRLALPKTAELRTVVKAINSMSDSIAKQFEQQVKEAHALRERAFKDLSSGLGNRAHFINQSTNWLAEKGSGGIALIQLPLIDHIYHEQGFEARDSFLKDLGAGLRELAEQDAGLEVARIANLEFAVLGQSYTQDEFVEFAENLQKLLQLARHEDAQFAMGVKLRDQEQNLGELLSGADAAMQQALERNDSQPVFASGAQPSLSRTQWKALIEECLDKQQLSYKRQAVHLLDGNVLHHELFTTIEVDAQRYAAGQFMPMIEQLRLGGQFDQLVADQAILALQQDDGLKLAINTSVSSLVDKGFLEWLQRFAERYQRFAPRLAFEFPEAAFGSENTRLNHVIQRLHHFGYQIGIDHYGRNFNSLSYLNTVKPHYVKIDYAYTALALGDEGDAHFLSAICRAAHNLQVLTIAQRVEDQAQLEQLRSLAIDGYQGYISAPEAFSIDGDK